MFIISTLVCFFVPITNLIYSKLVQPTEFSKKKGVIFHSTFCKLHESMKESYFGSLRNYISDHLPQITCLDIMVIVQHKTECVMVNTEYDNSIETLSHLGIPGQTLLKVVYYYTRWMTYNFTDIIHQHCQSITSPRSGMTLCFQFSSANTFACQRLWKCTERPLLDLDRRSQLWYCLRKHCLFARLSVVERGFFFSNEGQTFYLPYLRNGWFDWRGTKRTCIGLKLGKLYDLVLRPHPWPISLIFQGQSSKWLYLRNCWSRCCEAKRTGIN